MAGSPARALRGRETNRLYSPGVVEPWRFAHYECERDGRADRDPSQRYAATAAFNSGAGHRHPRAGATVCVWHRQAR
jgi:hypothetical protein